MWSQFLSAGPCCGALCEAAYAHSPGDAVGRTRIGVRGGEYQNIAKNWKVIQVSFNEYRESLGPVPNQQVSVEMGTAPKIVIFLSVTFFL